MYQRLSPLPDSNWAWPVKAKELWKLEKETKEWQEFYDHWRNSPTGPLSSEEFPYVLDLGVDSQGTPLLPFYSHRTTGNRILVTKSYNDMLHRLLRLRKRDRGNRKGVVLTGQPGTGASLSSDLHPVRQPNGISVLQEKPCF